MRALGAGHSRGILAGDLAEDLLAVDLDAARRVDADAHLIAADVEHRDDDLVTNDDRLT